jgi:hypothetical protein
MKSTPYKVKAGDRYGRLEILYTAYGLIPGLAAICHCDCGQVVRKSVHELKPGRVSSCGCYVKDRGRGMLKTHGYTGTSEHGIWIQMRARCNNTKHRAYPNYGGRGIKVCDRWDSFPNFLADMGLRPDQGHSLDRIDNNRGYSPDNCRWADLVTQGNNRRTCVHAEDLPGNFTYAEWSRKYNAPQWEFKNHLRYHTEEEALAIMDRKYGAIKELPTNV